MSRVNWDSFKAELITLPVPNITRTQTHILQDMWKTLTDKIKLTAGKYILITTYKIILNITKNLQRIITQGIIYTNTRIGTNRNS